MARRDRVGIAALSTVLLGTMSGCGALPSWQAVWNPMKAWRIAVNRSAFVTVHYDGWGARNPVITVTNKPHGASSWELVSASHGLDRPGLVSRKFYLGTGPSAKTPFDGLVKVVIVWDQGKQTDTLTDIYQLRPPTSPLLISPSTQPGT